MDERPDRLYLLGETRLDDSLCVCIGFDAKPLLGVLQTIAAYEGGAGPTGTPDSIGLHVFPMRLLRPLHLAIETGPKDYHLLRAADVRRMDTPRTITGYRIQDTLQISYEMNEEEDGHWPERWSEISPRAIVASLLMDNDPASGFWALRTAQMFDSLATLEMLRDGVTWMDTHGGHYTTSVLGSFGIEDIKPFLDNKSREVRREARLLIGRLAAGGPSVNERGHRTP